MTTNVPRVVVIGAGIGGLCLAQGLRRVGVDVTVYERDQNRDARLQGYRLSIEPPGARALRECLPDALWDAFRAASGDQGDRMGVFTEQLVQLMQEDPRSGSDDPDGGSHAVSRFSLRQILLSGLDDVVKFDKEFVEYRRTDAGVTACFADGSTASGDLLVGADGARSRVCGQFLPQARRIETPAIGIGGKLPLTDEILEWLPDFLTQTKNMILPRRDFLFTAVFRRRHSPPGTSVPNTALQAVLQNVDDNDYIMWAFVAHERSLHDVAGLRGEPLRQRVEHRMRDWHPDLRRLIAESGAVEQFKFAAAGRVRPWQSGDVTLLGDAIHYMPPVGGMGGNAALQDAATLTKAMARVQHGELTLPTALAGYEAEMLRRGFATVRETRLYTALAISRSAALRRIARGFFRLCGSVAPLRRAVFDD